MTVRAYADRGVPCPARSAIVLAGPDPRGGGHLTRMNWGIWSSVRLPGGLLVAHWQVGSLQVVGSHLYVSVAIKSAAGGWPQD